MTKPSFIKPGTTTDTINVGGVVVSLSDIKDHQGYNTKNVKSEGCSTTVAYNFQTGGFRIATNTEPPRKWWQRLIPSFRSKHGNDDDDEKA